ncbi:TetR/AcrR family transcriptional regulator [Phyllobacterium sp. SB3]|uniref:TetR/AcrR family transcriptional regulator n=1 Tax=Phyllobacterium sp. SB3 TaxID=3156073 RepID=UPI0032AEFF3A
MARPRSEEKREAILTAATELIATHGLGAATAEIAKRAHVPHGSVFTYFGTKAELLNTLYVELKTELIEALWDQMPDSDDMRTRLAHLWTNWTNWGVANPAKRRVLAQLGVSDQITDQSREAAFAVASEVVKLVRGVGIHGALREAPPAYIGALAETMAGTTMDFMSRDPANAETIREAGFAGLWRAIS